MYPHSGRRDSREGEGGDEREWGEGKEKETGTGTGWEYGKCGGVGWNGDDRVILDE
jgi:hypothetical protein